MWLDTENKFASPCKGHKKLNAAIDLMSNVSKKRRGSHWNCYTRSPLCKHRWTTTPTPSRITIGVKLNWCALSVKRQGHLPNRCTHPKIVFQTLRPNSVKRHYRRNDYRLPFPEHRWQARIKTSESVIPFHHKVEALTLRSTMPPTRFRSAMHTKINPCPLRNASDLRSVHPSQAKVTHLELSVRASCFLLSVNEFDAVCCCLRFKSQIESKREARDVTCAMTNN